MGVQWVASFCNHFIQYLNIEKLKITEKLNLWGFVTTSQNTQMYSLPQLDLMFGSTENLSHHPEEKSIEKVQTGVCFPSESCNLGGKAKENVSYKSECER